MSDIKIFVSHRIDQDNVTIDNPLFVNVRCGAVFDKRENVEMLGDNTGDNISEKRESFCELTVQYWAWKNVKADYYGLCHYRRYLSFSDRKLPEDHYQNIIMQGITDKTINTLCLDEKSMTKKIIQYDLILAQPSKVYSVYKQFGEAGYLQQSDLDLVVQIIHEKYPECDDAAKKYLSGDKFYPCNIFIMKKRLFFLYSEWLFDILFELERRLDLKNASEERMRTVGEIAERLLGIYFTYLKQKENININIMQRVLFINTLYQDEFCPAFNFNNVPIVFASNDYFAPILGVCLQSIINNSTVNNNYDIIILHRNIHKQNQQYLKSLIDGKRNFKIRFYNTSMKVINFNLKVHDHISVETYYRFLIQDILQKYDKAIYIDCDLIINRDIAELYNINLGTNCIGATYDVDFIGQLGSNKNTQIYAFNKLQLKNPYQYFQAGVLILNLYEMRKLYTVEELLEFAQKTEYKYMDQDILNIKFQNKVKYIDLRWNVLSDCAHYRLDNVIKYAPCELYQEYLRAREDPYIIHYAGFSKPWNNPEEDYGIEFWKTARQTIFYEMLIHKIAISTSWQSMTDYRNISKNSKKFHSFIKKILYFIVEKIFPKGTTRRSLLKKYYFNLRRWNDIENI